MKSIRRRILCFALTALLTITLIPAVSYGAETASSGEITGFAPLEHDTYYYEGDPTEKDITSELPDTIDVYLNGSSEKTAIGVEWESLEDFNDTDFYFYSMKPVWKSAYTLSSELNSIMDVPWITIFKEEPLADELEPMVTEDESEPIYVNKDEAEKENGATDPEKDSVEKDSDAVSKVLHILGEESYAANTTNTDKVYNYLTKTMGLNMAAACGVMTNINAESGMSPINLENTYNTKFGLTDEEYTKRVNNGKGAYKTKSGASRNFKTDYCGYGLCQWTSLGRRKNLLNKALDKGVSIGDANMQMEFLNDELKNSYSSVLNTLKAVPNNAQGAYMAAFIFCMSFEVPANTLNTAASRGKTCLSSSGYWKKYNGSTISTTGTSFMSLVGYSYPKSMKSGKGMTVKGYAVSNYNVTSVKANIKDANGVTKYSASASPNSTVYNLSNFDDKLLFSKLAAGTYTYTLTAKDKSGKSIKAAHKFTVSSSNSNSITNGFCMDDSTTTQPEQPAEPTQPEADAPSTMDIYSFNYPTTLKKGKGFTIKGTIKSNYTINKVLIRVRVKSTDKLKLSTVK